MTFIEWADPECYEYVNKSKEISKANNWSSHAESNIR